MGDIRKKKRKGSLTETMTGRSNSKESVRKGENCRERSEVSQWKHQSGNDVYWKEVEDDNKRSLMEKIRKDDCEGKEGGRLVMDGMSIKGMERERKRGGYGFWVNLYERGEERIEWS